MMNYRKKYTLAFIFNKNKTKVLLIQKERPKWQKGLLNGIGGHIEENETSLQCIKREVNEETTLKIQTNAFKYFAKMYGTDWEVDCYVSIYNKKETDAKTNTDEKVSWFDIENLPKNTISNVSWLIQMAKDSYENDLFKIVDIEYKS